MDLKQFISKLGFAPKENTIGIYTKKYPFHNGYSIDVDFDKKSIDYHEIICENKTTQNFSQPENFVVLECVDRLLSKGYTPQHIILEKTWPSGHGTSGRLDICVTDEDDSPYLLIECKTYGKEFDKELAKTSKNGGQLFTYFQLSGGKADVIMLYASELKGAKIVYKNEIIKIEDEYRSGEVKDIYEKWNKLTKDNGIFDSWVKPYNFQNKALTKEQLKEIRPEDSSFIFNRFLEILRHNVVSDKGNAFNKIFTLFLCKVYDETSTVDGEELQFQWKEGIDNHVDFQLRLTELYSKGMQKFLERTVSDFNEDDFNKRCANLNEETKKYLLDEVKKLRLEKNNEFAIKEVYDNQSFEENARVVKEVVELIQGYKIRYNKRQQYLSDFFELLLTTGLKQEAGQFFTPVPIAQFIIKSLPLDIIVTERLQQKNGEILPYMIDYASGSGHFLTEYMHEVQGIINQSNPKDYIDATTHKIKHWQGDHFDWATQYVYGVEKDYRLVKVGKVGCYLHGDGLANVILSDGLAGFTKNKEYKGKLRKNAENTSKDNQQFDVLLSNPPYSVYSFRQTTRDYYTENDFELYGSLTDNSSEIECLFVERTKQLLKDGGVAGVILPSSILSNAGIYSKTREMILQYFDIVAITELGSNTFMATGTNTVVLFLRRRNNFDSKNIRDAVENYFKFFNDVTINGIEKPVAKYVAHVWEGLDYADYVTLLQKTPNDKVKAHEIYADYRKKIRAKDETKFWQEVLELESEKLLYFIIAYPQKVVLVKSGEKDAEKRFLGYEFSNRRGSEGIHPIQRGKNIEDCTQLFDPHSYNNPDKASTYIQRAFNNDYDSEIAESMQGNVSRISLVDMFTFDRVYFEKTISTAVKKKVAIESKWPQVKLENLSLMLKRGKSTKYGNSAIQIIKSGQARGYKSFDFTEKHFVSDNFVLDERKLESGDILINSSGVGTAGRVTLFDMNGTFVVDSHITILRPDKSKILPNYIMQSLAYIGFDRIESLALGQSGQIELSISTIQNIKIPLPPKEIQAKIVTEIEAVEAICEEAVKSKEKLTIQIEETANSLYNNGKLQKIGSLCSEPMYGAAESAVPGNPEIDYRYIRVTDINENGSLNDDWKTAEKVDLKYRLSTGDVLFARSGATAGKAFLYNESFGKAIFAGYLIRFQPNIHILTPKYLQIVLKSRNYKDWVLQKRQGAAQPNINAQQFAGFEIPVLSIDEQQKIVSEIEALEKEIATAQEIIDRIPEQQAAILKKYL